MKATVFAAALLLSLTIQTAKADPVVLGDPSMGTPITTIDDGNSKVKITTNGISVDDGDQSKSISVTPSGTKITHNISAKTDELEDILVPVAFFAFLIAVILGGKYLSSRNEERRLELLKLMVEKGQPVPEAVMNQILSPAKAPEDDGTRQVYKRTRNAYGFTIAGVLLLGYALLTQQLHNTGVLVTGLTFICLGAGGMAGLYLPKRDEKTPGQ